MKYNYFAKKISMNNLPKKISVFPLSNFIIFPNTTVPLNIFEPRYLDLVNDSLKSNKLIGIIQPKKNKNQINMEKPELHKIGCLGKIVNFKETNDGRYLIDIKGLIRFETLKEIENNKKRYREFEVNFNNFHDDLNDKKNDLKFSDLELVFKDFKNLFEKKGYIINWKALEKQSLEETINALSMASPFSLEEKQILLETKEIYLRKIKISEILSTYTYDNFNNNTIQ